MEFDVVYEYVYKGVQCGPYAGKLSALVVTPAGDVYGAGTNTLVRCNTYHYEYPMKDGLGPILSNWVKIDRLCGLGIRKIIVGTGFGAALTVNYELLTWGQGMVTFLGKQAIVMFEVDGFHTTCNLCENPHNYEIHTIGKVAFNYCQLTHTYPVYTESYPPPEGVKVKRFLRACGEMFVPCSFQKCTSYITTKFVNSIPLFHCPNCDNLWNLDEDVGFFGRHEGIRPKLSLACVWDIAPTLEGISLLRKNNQLEWKIFDKNQGSRVYLVPNPKKLQLTAVYGCKHDVARTCTGGVCNGLLGEIYMPAKVIKICAGWNAVACLLEDQSIWVILKDQSPKQLLMFGGGTNFKDIAAAQWCDTFYVQGDTRTEIKMDDPESDSKIIFKVSEADCRAELLKAVCSQSWPISSTEAQTPLVCEHPSIPLPPFLVSLYGKKQLSDLTLKLQNEDFPAHRSVLMSKSAHFKKILSSSTALHVTLNMSTFNPKAYKCLLQYYYQHEPDDLDLDELLELYTIACSYEEIQLASFVEKKLATKINTKNVLHAYGMCHMLNIKKVKNYCENLMRSTNFKEKFFEKALREPIKFLVLPE